MIWGSLTVEGGRGSGLIDDNGSWVGGDTMVVQTGDLTDRGEDGRETLEFIRDVETKSKGNFITLIGNHEAMNVMDDLRYVHPSDTKGFGGAEKRLQAFDPGGCQGADPLFSAGPIGLRRVRQCFSNTKSVFICCLDRPGRCT